MAVSPYLILTPYNGSPLVSTSSTVIGPSKDLAGTPIQPGTLIHLQEFSGAVEQTLNIGSQSTGAGAGKIIFDPFQVRRPLDDLSPRLLLNCASGTPFKQLDLLLIKASENSRGVLFAQYTFKLAAIKTIGTSATNDVPVEDVSFEYGGFQVRYAVAGPTGTAAKVLVGGWNRVKNVSDVGTSPIT